MFYSYRYFGEDKVEEQTNKADAILKKLKADAEARKRQRELGAGKSPLDYSKSIQRLKDNEDKTSRSAQRKQTVKRSKLKDFDDAKSVSEVTPKKKRKRNLDKNITEEGNDSNDTNNENLNQKDSITDSKPNSNDIGSEIAPSKSKFKGKSKSVLENDDGEEEEDDSGFAVEDHKVEEAEPMEDTQEGAHEFGGFTVLGDYKSKQTGKVNITQCTRSRYINDMYKMKSKIIYIRNIVSRKSTGKLIVINNIFKLLNHHKIMDSEVSILKTLV